MKNRTISYSILTVFTVLVLAACGSAGMVKTNQVADQAGLPAPTAKPEAMPAQPEVVAGGDLLAAYQGTLENIYASVSPSVVNISVVTQVDSVSSNSGFPFFSLPNGQQPQQQYQSALGSGFIWDASGDIVTNNHVVKGADKIEVTFSDGTVLPATLVGADPDSDLAVIHVDASAALLQPVQMGDSRNARVGQLAIAIGNPFGLEGTMTTGIISALGRSLPADETLAQSYTIPDVIQTDAPINPGNSGGVLVDSDGMVIGVTAAIESPIGANAGIGFAIPSDIVNRVVPALIKDGEFVHSWLGISGISLFPDIATAMALDANQHGALVEEVLDNSPAKKAGLKGSTDMTTVNNQSINIGGDVITAIDMQPVHTMDDLIAYLVSSTEVGQTVSLDILRGGKQISVEVTLAERPSPEERASTQTSASARGVHLGIIQEMNLPKDLEGVLVVDVEADSPAAAAGLQAGSQPATIEGQTVNLGGDVITAVNGQSITSALELKAALAQLFSDQPLDLTILREGHEMHVTVLPNM